LLAVFEPIRADPRSRRETCGLGADADVNEDVPQLCWATRFEGHLIAVYFTAGGWIIDESASDAHPGIRATYPTTLSRD
jgi:hypothetical protein